MRFVHLFQLVVAASCLRPHPSLGPPGVSRRALLLSAAGVGLPVRRSLALDLEAAVPAVSSGVSCKTASCQVESLEKLNSLLDVSGVPKNAKGEAAAHAPRIVVKNLQGIKEGTPLRVKAKVIVERPLSASNFPRVSWVVDEATGKIVAARAFSADDAPPFKLIYTHIYDAEVDLAKQRLVPRVYWAEDGLWEGEPFSLLAAGKDGE